ncbi:tyrosine-type recombinase/integrase [Enterocloster clostridioformis]|uniref:tyrosine-type recombinase/integrase n=1 Tax=Enterocloster clostridioformis TaxID=1531 RepID=UPI001FA7C622|nr:tyrosine-type recombinase/integrase [Enterocloster clostridioformis]
MECGVCYGYVKHCRTILKALILFFDAIGIHAPEEVSYTHLERFINSLVGWSASTVRSRISLVRMYFRFLFLNGDIKEPIAEKLPGGLTPRGRTKLPTVWQEDEINKLLGSIDLTNPNGKRNYAMLLLAARLGLRIGDIRELKLSDIDWQACTLTIIQNKTKEPLTLPVPDDVGWAVIDYLKNGRPVTESKNVFVRHVPPYNSFAITSSLHNIMTKALSDAGITYRGKPSGFHTLRHSLATHLLQGGVESSAISDILGHTSPETVKHYLQADLKDLRKSALEVEVRPYVKE